MIYDIKLRIDYDYEAPSDHTRNVLHLLPDDLGGKQRVLSRLLDVRPPPNERRESRDFFGNTASSVSWHYPIDAVSFDLVARVERLADPALLDISPPLGQLRQEISEMQTLSADAPHHFLSPSPRIAEVPEITAFVRSLITPGMSTARLVETLGHALYTRMHYDAEATTVDTPPAEAFAQKRGVCQDFAQIMIAGLRGVGVPAGYVSGFLRTFPPPGQPRLEGADAMHAWVRAWVGHEMGWIEFDPTNDQPAGIDYVTLAIGRDYADVAPVRGAMRSAGSHATTQSVDVIPLDGA